MKYIIVTFLLITSLGLKAQRLTDTTKINLGDTIRKDLLTVPDTVSKLHSKALAFVPPLVLISYGVLSFPVHAIRQVDYDIHSEVTEHYPTFHSVAESYFQFSPVAAVYVLNLVGIEGKNRFVDRTAMLGLSAGIFAGSTRIIKKSTHRLRPNGENTLSFPSGHTGTAFMGAEFLAQEFSEKSVWYGIAGYTVAGLTGVFRIGNRDHWFSDTVAGAGFGILSTKAAYFVYPYIRDVLTHKSKSGKSASLVPAYQDGIPGVSFAMQL